MIIDTSSTRRQHKILVILGPTGAGKTKLSIDLATTFFPDSEIINADKIQLYRGLDITTNKITFSDQLSVKHHLLGDVDPLHFLSPAEFRSVASTIISDIISRRRLPIVVGGSNSLIYTLLVKRFDPKLDVFNGPNPDPVSPELRYNCCFLTVDVSLPVLNLYLDKRVDEMLELGMVEELQEFYNSGEFDSVNESGLRKAIGVPEFERYFACCCCTEGTNAMRKTVVYEEAVNAIKDNTCRLAKKQVGKIQRLRDARWDLRKIDATAAFRVVVGLDSGERVANIWEKQVVETSVKIVKRFLEQE